MTRSELFDLHVHTTASDGVRSPLQLAEMARRCGLAGLALTDHDTLVDPATLPPLEQMTGVRLFLGIELSTHFEGRSFHLLGYGFDPRHADLVEACRRLQGARRQRWNWMLDQLKRMGVTLDSKKATPLSNASIGRLHLARELVRARVVPTVRTAFDRYLTRFDEGGPSAQLELREAVALLHSAGGVAVLAHPPARLDHREWTALAMTGIDGLETRFPSASNRHRRFLQERAQEYGLVQTAGSDYHGGEPREELGRETVDREAWEAVLARRPVPAAKSSVA